ncbi:MAG: hypothetical protein RIR18_1719, partial [Pseudomonadota bacterium]
SEIFSKILIPLSKVFKGMPAINNAEDIGVPIDLLTIEIDFLPLLE